MSLSDFSLENKVALITGGTSGLGKMMALALAKAGPWPYIIVGLVMTVLFIGSLIFAVSLVLS